LVNETIKKELEESSESELENRMETIAKSSNFDRYKKPYKNSNTELKLQSESKNKKIALPKTQREHTNDSASQLRNYPLFKEKDRPMPHSASNTDLYSGRRTKSNLSPFSTKKELVLNKRMGLEDLRKELGKSTSKQKFAPVPKLNNALSIIEIGIDTPPPPPAHYPSSFEMFNTFSSKCIKREQGTMSNRLTASHLSTKEHQ
jgi:hypothetical protein